MDKNKHLAIRKITEGSPSCICDGIPALEIIYNVPDGGGDQAWPILLQTHWASLFKGTGFIVSFVFMRLV